MRSSYIVASAAAAGGALLSLLTFGACSTPAAEATSDASADVDAAPPRDAAEAEAATAATFAAFTARAIGRAGGDLQVVVEGEDLTQTAYGIHLRLRDAWGLRVLAFQGNWSGTSPGTFGANAAERRVLFDPSDGAGQTTLARTVTLPGFLKDFPAIDNVEVAILTGADVHSKKLLGPVSAQAVRAEAEACDPAMVTDRCSPGLACAGAPPTCAAAPAPHLVQLAYVPGTEGPHILLEGFDPAGAIESLHVELLNAKGSPTMVDLSGNGDFAKSQELRLAAPASLGWFFVDHPLAPRFAKDVPRLAVTPLAPGGPAGVRATALLGAAAQRAAGEACDPRGFVGCEAGNVCARGPAPGRSVCVDAATAMAAVLDAAPTIDLSSGPRGASGYARGTSMWEPPSSCAPASASGRPEGIVRLHVPLDRATLTISTAIEVTNFDTVLYLLADSEGGSALGCNDDAKGSASSLTVTDLPAGDYTIVVDSKDANGGNFGVSVR
jgi:hypothetical protein